MVATIEKRLPRRDAASLHDMAAELRSAPRMAIEDVGAIHGGDFVAPMNSEVLTDQEAYDAAELQLGFCVAENTSLQKMSEWKGCEAD